MDATASSDAAIDAASLETLMLDRGVYALVCEPNVE